MADSINIRIESRGFNLIELRNTINRTMDDCMISLIPSGTIGAGGANDWPRIRRALADWDNEGLLEILSDPETNDPKEPCVRMKRYIGMKSPYPGFLNYE